jgi:hypothetical protein
MKSLIWLMSRFNVSPELIGDIAEDQAAYRSLPRFARQCVVAMITTVFDGLWHNKRLTLCALETGWMLAFIGSQVPNATMPWWAEQPYQLQVAYVIAISLLLGWIVARIQDRQPLGAVLLFLSPMVLLQVTSEGYYIRAKLGGAGAGDLVRFIAIQFWFAWMPLLTALVPALLRRPNGSLSPD